eukprot:2978085-Amphidinium_carterae.1
MSSVASVKSPQEHGLGIKSPQEHGLGTPSTPQCATELDSRFCCATPLEASGRLPCPNLPGSRMGAILGVSCAAPLNLKDLLCTRVSCEDEKSQACQTSVAQILKLMSKTTS